MCTSGRISGRGGHLPYSATHLHPMGWRRMIPRVSPGYARHLGTGLSRFRRIALATPVAVAAALVLVPLHAAPAAAAVDPCGPPVVSVIACENTQTGDAPADWQVTGSGDQTIPGVGTSARGNPGDTVPFKVKT